ncbi:MAG: hypothetical protein H6595_14535 [Flavobacteriales bacterium]|nr:hypothetical protein [Flavobacteriales bacterium]MCB9168684.1 hypothetical protein [Flavobacteriales bacterium]
MSQNPFQIIRPTDKPPETIRKEVMSSVKLVMLLMRFVQLFMADYASSLFDKVRLLGPSDTHPKKNGGPGTDR